MAVSGRNAPTGGASVVVSCEHGGNEIPAAYARYFESPAAREALASHRGWDPGSLEVAESFAAALGAPLVAQRVSRLLVECNRSLEHPRLFSELSRRLSDAERAEVVDRYWRRHREAVRERVRSAPPGTTVVHVGVHTFTPVWKGRRRTTTIGLLYDPRRTLEADLVGRWRRELALRLPAELLPADQLPADRLRVHLNRPYRGWTDGLTTTLRGELPESRYLGIELEVSQGLVGGMGGDVVGEVVGGPGPDAVGQAADHTAVAREIGGMAAVALKWVLED